MTIDIKYENYSVKDFLEDDLFLQWQLAPTETLDEFWKQVLQQYPHQEANLSDAVRTLHSVTINHVSLSRREEDKMLQNIYARYRRHRVRRFIYWSTSVAASLILLFLLVSPLRDFTGEKVNVMLTDVQSVRLDTIQDVQLIIGEKKTIAMAEDADIISEYLDKWHAMRNIEDEYHRDDYELKGIKELIRHSNDMNLDMFGVFIDGKLEAFTLGTYLKREETAYIHVEKANPEIRGLYPFINQQFLIHCFPTAKWVNREDDMGLEGLRKAKMSYNPAFMAKKYNVYEK